MVVFLWMVHFKDETKFDVTYVYGSFCDSTMSGWFVYVLGFEVCCECDWSKFRCIMPSWSNIQFCWVRVICVWFCPWWWLGYIQMLWFWLHLMTWQIDMLGFIWSQHKNALKNMMNIYGFNVSYCTFFQQIWNGGVVVKWSWGCHSSTIKNYMWPKIGCKHSLKDLKGFQNKFGLAYYVILSSKWCRRSTDNQLELVMSGV